MTTQSFEIKDGPDKPALQRAVVYPDQEHTVVFKTNAQPLEVVLTEMAERGDGFEFKIKGRLVSGDGAARAVEGFCSIETRSGRINVLDLPVVGGRPVPDGAPTVNISRRR